MPRPKRQRAAGACGAPGDGAGQQAEAGAAALLAFPDGLPPSPGFDAFANRAPPAELREGMQPYVDGTFSLAAIHPKRIFDLAFRPGGSSVLATGSDDDMVGLWQRRAVPVEGEGKHRHAWQQAACLAGHSDSVMRVCWVGGTGLLATGSADRSAALWRPSLGQEGVDVQRSPLRRFEGHPEEVYASESLAAAGHSQLLTASAKSLFIWDIETGAKLHETRHGAARAASAEPAPPDPTAGYIFGARERPGGGLIAAPCSDGVLRLWEAAPGAARPLSAIRLHDGVGTSVAFEAEGNLLASASTDGSLVVLDVRAWRVVMRFKGSTPLMSACFLPPRAGGCCVAAAGQDGNLWGFDLAPGGGMQQLNAYALPVLGSWPMLCVAASDDGQRLACAGEAMEVDGATMLDDNLGAHREMTGGEDAASNVFFTNNPQHETNRTRAVAGIWQAGTMDTEATAE
eukprot:jgi/Tetstr1/433374/TSEL_022659.t1